VADQAYSLVIRRCTLSTVIRFLTPVLVFLFIAGCSKATPKDAGITHAVPLSLPKVTVYKSPTCGCCSAWVEHLRTDGFSVEVVEQADLSPRKAELGVPPAMGSCHTAVVDGYVIEGHVPASDIRRLLNERPTARGLAVPGMPAGSPGMEMGSRRDPYTVWLFGDEAQPQAFARHGSN
jgi:hypothetical protein